MDPRVEKMARVLVDYSLAVGKGDWVVIQSTALAEPLVDACVSAVLRAGGNPTVELGSTAVRETLLAEANDEQLAFIPPTSKLVVEKADATLNILAPANTQSLAGVDPANMATRQRASEPLIKTHLDRSASGDLQWTIAQYPTEAAAQDAGMSLRDYEQFVYDGGLLNEADPVQAWQRLGERQQRLVEWLSDKSEIHIKATDTDLKLSVAGRTWINDQGNKNFPGGEVFTGPLEDSVQGVIAFNYPAFLSVEVQGVRLRFEGGKVVDASASAGEQYLLQMLDMDPGARRLGEFSFGTNPGIQRFTKNTLFDEKIGGTLHMALGRSIPETAGVNISVLHWDMVYNLREGAEVTVDGKAFSRNGEFQV